MYSEVVKILDRSIVKSDLIFLVYPSQLANAAFRVVLRKYGVDKYVDLRENDHNSHVGMIML